MCALNGVRGKILNIMQTFFVNAEGQSLTLQNLYMYIIMVLYSNRTVITHNSKNRKKRGNQQKTTPRKTTAKEHVAPNDERTLAAAAVGLGSARLSPVHELRGGSAFDTAEALCRSVLRMRMLPCLVSDAALMMGMLALI